MRISKLCRVCGWLVRTRCEDSVHKGSGQTFGARTPPMTTGQKHITVCVCTFQRPGLLRKLLECLEEHRTNGRFTFSVVVTDNDSGRSSERVVAEFVATSKIAVTYTCESRQNIALAR